MYDRGKTKYKIANSNNKHFLSLLSWALLTDICIEETFLGLCSRDYEDTNAGWSPSFKVLF